MTRRIAWGLVAAFMIASLTACASTERSNGDRGGAVITSGQNEPVAASGVVPSGTTMTVALNDELSVEKSQEGDTFTARLVEPVRSGGQVIIPTGATVTGRVTGVQRAGGEYEHDVMKLDFSRIEVEGQSYPLEATLVEANPTYEDASSTQDKITYGAGGAAAGAIVGAIIGEGTGALIGAALGAVAGTAIVMGTGDETAVLAEDSRLRLRTDSQIVRR